MSDDWVALLGVKGGPAIYPGGPLPTASLARLAGRTIVVDCGAGVAAGIARQGVTLTSIDMVFVTHLHSDHVLDLGPLLHTAWTAGLDHRVDVFGPPGLARYWRHFLESMAFDIATRIDDEGRPPLAGLVALHEIGEGGVFTDDTLSIAALRVAHPPVTDCFALRFEARGKRIVFSADTAYHPPLAAFAHRADLLVHEALYPDGVERLIARIGNAGARLRRHLYASHTSATDAGRIAAMAEVTALALNHLIPADDPAITPAHWEAAVRAQWQGVLHIATDGMRIAL